MGKNDKLERVEDGIKMLLDSTAPVPTKVEAKVDPLAVEARTESGSQRILRQIDSMCESVYDHVVDRIKNLKTRLDQLETTVTSKCEHMKLYTEQYIHLAENAMKAADHIEAAVEALEKHVGEVEEKDQPPKTQ